MKAKTCAQQKPVVLYKSRPNSVAGFRWAGAESPGPDPSGAWQGAVLLQGMGHHRDPRAAPLRLYQAGKLDASTREQPGTRSTCRLKGEDHHLQIQGRVKEKGKGLNAISHPFHNLLMMINEDNGQYPTDFSGAQV